MLELEKISKVHLFGGLKLATMQGMSQRPKDRLTSKLRDVNIALKPLSRDVNIALKPSTRTTNNAIDFEVAEFLINTCLLALC